MTKPDWTTRMPSEFTRPFGVEELHQVFFEPDGWPGKGIAVSLLIPECELQVVSPKGDTVEAVVNRPKHNKNVKRWMRVACELATENRALLALVCDTIEQADQAAKRATKWLPNHRRMAVERTFDPATRARGNLS